MHAFKVPLKKAERAKTILIKNNLLDKKYIPEKTEKHFLFPVLKEEKKLEKKIGGTFIDFNFNEIKQKNDFKAHLREILSEDEIKKLPASYDIMGDIIIIDLKNNTHEKEIGESLLKANRNIKTILKKSGIHEGEFRTQPLSYVAGEKRKETVYKENKILLKLDVEQVYFSPRLSTERKRIYEQIKKNEKVLVMFSGCGPYPITISKNTMAKKIIGIEKNPIAHKYGIKNLLLNKVKNIELINGDVREEVSKTKQKFDRIIMPLPKGAEDFLDIAFFASKKGTMIHLYDFEHETELDFGEKKVRDAAKKLNKKIKILRTVKCGQYSPGKFRICVDFSVL